ncbi:tRNA (guanosine(37)-N1)-methyltransferase TrmD [bacterium]|nr:tRNA (guanosine(37)-N1)-methyltransferase TrmD [bacterium]
MLINIVTAFPEFYDSFINTSLVKKAINNNIIEFNIVDLKLFGVGRFPRIDDTQYGGGAGMVIKVDVVKKALDSLKNKGKVIALTAKGDLYSQKTAILISKSSSVTILNGRYEGFDERVFKYVDYKISIGEFITMGGEAPSLCLIESAIRLIPGVLGKLESTEKESYGKNVLSKHPVYTKPALYDSTEVPKVLTEGNHKEIEDWRKANSRFKPSL